MTADAIRTVTDRRVLDEAGGWRAMTGVIAVMLFLTVLVTALGLGTARAAHALERELGGRVTVQLVTGAAADRDARAARLAEQLRRTPDVLGATVVPRSELVRLLRPWLGSDGDDPALPVPAMIDVDLKGGGTHQRTEAAIARLAPGARIDSHQAAMAPVERLLAMLSWLAFALALLMAAATAAVVVLAARAGLETHRPTIEIMHILGSTDVQLARLFQRRLAADAALGGLAGALAAFAVLIALGNSIAGLGSALLGAMRLGTGQWLVLAALPFGFIALAVVAARFTVLAAVRRTL